MEIICTDLPSKGLVYNTKLENIKVRTLKGKDEKVLAEMSMDNVEKKYAELLRSVVSGIDANSLTLGDRAWLLVWERINSYSAKFPVVITCECCFQKVALEINLADLDVVYLPDTFKEPYPIKLENNETVNLRLFRVSDEIKLIDLMKKSGAGNAYMYHWALSIVDDEKDIPTKINYLENLDSRDLMKIKDFHKTFEHGPKLNNCSYVCPKCGGEGHMTLPFRPDFLIPSSEDIA
jgi:hypothetical protein